MSSLFKKSAECGHRYLEEYARNNEGKKEIYSEEEEAYRDYIDYMEDMDALEQA